MVPKNSLIGSRDSLVKRVEMPVFQGHNTHGWIAKIEIFFSRLSGYNDEEKWELVSVSLEWAVVLSWFKSELHRKSYEHWRDFKERLITGSARRRSGILANLCVMWNKLVQLKITSMSLKIFLLKSPDLLSDS